MRITIILILLFCNSLLFGQIKMVSTKTNVSINNNDEGFFIIQIDTNYQWISLTREDGDYMKFNISKHETKPGFTTVDGLQEDVTSRTTFYVNQQQMKDNENFKNFDEISFEYTIGHPDINRKDRHCFSMYYKRDGEVVIELFFYIAKDLSSYW